LYSPLDIAALLAVPPATQNARLVLRYLAKEFTRRERSAAFAMGYHERLGRNDVGKPSPLLDMSPEVLRYILEKAEHVNHIENTQ